MYSFTLASQSVAKCSKVSARKVAFKAAAADKPIGIECMWYPGAECPEHLDMSLPGCYGFDPLGLAKDPASLKWYQEAELTNGRWAMAACAGVIATDHAGLAKWYEAGAAYELPVPIETLIGFEVLILGFFEYKRYENYIKTGTGGLLGWAPFDPMNANSSEMAVKEVKNGRLAMMSFAGYVTQYQVTGKSPLENLADHLASPNTNNIMTSFFGGSFAYVALMLAFAPILMEFNKFVTTKFEAKTPGVVNMAFALTPFYAAIFMVQFASQMPDQISQFSDPTQFVDPAASTVLLKK